MQANDAPIIARSKRARVVLFALKVLGLIPLPLLRLLGIALGTIVSLLPLRESKVTRRNLALCLPSHSAAERKKLHRSSLQHVLMSVFELPKIWTRPYPELAAYLKEIHGAEILQAALDSGRGVLIAAPHLGAWELLNLFLAQQTELAILYRAPRQAWVEAVLNGARSRTRAVPIRAEPSAVRGLLKRLQSGGAIGILPDQQPKQGEGEFAPMFGISALTMTLLPKLALRTGATVLFASCVRVPGGFRIDIRQADPAVVDVASLNVNVEASANPWLAQYQWSYKRYSMRPEGAARLY
jgi:Kdo2-lipid IVA lauroyltransferase/acyltransferase